MDLLFSYITIIIVIVAYYQIYSLKSVQFKKTIISNYNERKPNNYNSTINNHKNAIMKYLLESQHHY